MGEKQQYLFFFFFKAGSIILRVVWNNYFVFIALPLLIKYFTFLLLFPSE